MSNTDKIQELRSEVVRLMVLSKELRSENERVTAQLNRVSNHLEQIKGEFVGTCDENTILKLHAKAVQKLQIELIAEGKRRDADNQTLRQRVAELEAALPRWIPVEERLPDNVDDVLVTTDDKKLALGWYHTTAHRWFVIGESTRITVTNWMPLPEHPTALAPTQEAQDEQG